MRLAQASFTGVHLQCTIRDVEMTARRTYLITDCCNGKMEAGIRLQKSGVFGSRFFLLRYCALICSPSANDDQCGTNASCKSVQASVGLCTYDDDKAVKSALNVKYTGEKDVVV